MRKEIDRGSLSNIRYRRCLVSVYAIWAAAVAAIALMPDGAGHPDARAFTGLAAAHQDRHSQQTIVLRQLRAAP